MQQAEMLAKEAAEGSAKPPPQIPVGRASKLTSSSHNDIKPTEDPALPIELAKPEIQADGGRVVARMPDGTPIVEYDTSCTHECCAGVPTPAGLPMASIMPIPAETIPVLNMTTDQEIDFAKLMKSCCELDCVVSARAKAVEGSKKIFTAEQIQLCRKACETANIACSF